MVKRRKQATQPFHAWPLAIVLLAFALRFAAAMQLGNLPLSRSPQLDSHEYLTWGRRIASGDFTIPNPPPHGPGYPFFLGAILAVSGGSLLAVHIVQAALGALTCWFTGAAARAWFGERAGIASSAILAVYAPLIWIDASLYAEGLLICLMAAFLWSIATRRHLAVSTILLACATVVRPTALALLPILFIFGARTWRARAVLAAVVVTAFVALAIPIQAYGGLNFYIGNSPLRDGTASARIGGDWDRIERDAARHGQLSVRAEDRYFIRKAFDEIAQHPFAYLRLLLHKTALTFGNDEVRDTFSFYFYRQFSRALWLVPFAVLFGLAVAGALVIDRRSEGARAAGLYVLLTALTSIALVVGSRYRMPMVIGLAIVAGVIVSRAPLRMTVAAIVAAIACFLVRDPRSHNFSEEWAWTARSLQREGDLDAAKEAARKAVAGAPQSALAYDALGTSEPSATDAIPLLARAVAINPDFFEARLHLAGAYAAVNQPVQAERQYGEAIRIDPRDPRPVKRAAQIAMQQRKMLDAITLFARASQLDPHDAESVWQVARLWGAVGKPELGLDAAKRAVSLEQPTGDQWLLTATLAIHAHRFDVAQNALLQAQAAGANPLAVAFANALLQYQRGDLESADALVDSVLQQAPNSTEAQILKMAIGQARRRR